MKNSNIENLVDGYIEIFKAFESIKKEKFIEENFDISNYGVVYFQEILSAIGRYEDQLQYSKYFRNEDLENEVIENMLEKISNDNFSMEDLYVLKTSLKLDPNKGYNNISSTIAKQLDNFKVNPKNMDPIFSSLFLIYKYTNSSNKNDLENLVSNGKIYYYIDEAQSNHCFKSLSACFLIILINFNKPSNINLPTLQRNKAINGRSFFINFLNQNYENKEEIWKEFVYLLNDNPKLYDELLENKPDPEKDPLVYEILKTIIRAHFGLDKKTATNTLSRFIIRHNNFIRETLEQEKFAENTKLILEREPLITLIKEVTFNRKNQNHCSFAESILTLNLENKEFVDWIYKPLPELNTETWKEEINYNDEYFKSVLTILSSKYRKKFGNTLMEALNTIAKETIDSDKILKFDSLKPFIDSLDQNNSNILQRNILDMIINNVEKNLSNFIEIFGMFLNNNDILRKKADEILRKYLMKKIDSGSIIELRWGIEMIKNANLFDKRLVGIKDLINPIKGKIKEKKKHTEEEDLKNILNELLRLFR